MAEKIKLTKAKVDKIPFPQDGRVDYFDKDLKGFGVRVSSTKKVYFVLRRVNGKLSRVTLGPANTLSAEQARREAENVIAEMNRGNNVNEEKRKARVRGRSLEDVFKDYQAARDLKQNTVDTYQKLLDFHLADWKKLSLAEIKPQMVADRHKKIGKSSGKAPANNTMRTLRAIYNHGLAVCSDLPDNPVKRLTLTKQWYRVDRRKTIVPQKALEKWYGAIKAYPNPVIQDYILLLLFTGLRREEAASIKWEDVDLEEGTFTIIDTKNRKKHTLPMSEFIHGLFERRLAARENDYVFPGRKEGQHLKDPRKAINQITEKTGVKFCNHDLRRTFSTIAEGLVSYSILKSLLNHSAANDVTQGYLVHSIDDLRAPMQIISSSILGLCGQPQATVVKDEQQSEIA